MKMSTINKSDVLFKYGMRYLISGDFTSASQYHNLKSTLYREYGINNRIMIRPLVLGKDSLESVMSGSPEKNAFNHRIINDNDVIYGICMIPKDLSDIINRADASYHVAIGGSVTKNQADELCMFLKLIG